MNLKTEHLAEALATVAPAIDRNPTIEILKCVKLEATEGNLTVIGSNLEIEIRCTVAADFEKASSICIPYQKLVSITNAAAVGAIKISSTSTEQISITTKNSRHRINSLPAADFAGMNPSNSGTTIAIEAAIFAEHIARVQHCAARNDVRYYLNGIYISLENDAMTLTASDGHRMGRSICQAPTDQQASCIIPIDAAQAITKTFKFGAITITIGDANIHAVGKHASIICSVISGKYPDVGGLFETPRNHSISTNAGQLSDAVAAAMATTEEHGKVSFDFQSDAITLTSHDSTSQESTSSAECIYDGDPIQIEYNSRYVIDALKKINGESILEVGIDAKSDGRGMVVRPKDGDFSYLIMPMY